MSVVVADPGNHHYKTTHYAQLSKQLISNKPEYKSTKGTCRTDNNNWNR